MAKSTISPELLKRINKSVDDAVKKAAAAIIRANKEFDAPQRDYFRETERLLYSLPALRLKVSQDEEDLKNNQLVYKQKSTDVVRISRSSSRSSQQDTESREEHYIEQRKASMERTITEIQRIERALETIQDDEYYEIVPLKYWDQLTPTEIAKKISCDERTFYRHKNRLVNKLKVVLFGADAL